MIEAYIFTGSLAVFIVSMVLFAIGCGIAEWTKPTQGTLMFEIFEFLCGASLTIGLIAAAIFVLLLIGGIVDAGIDNIMKPALEEIRK